MWKLFKNVKRTCNYVRVDQRNTLEALNISDQWCALIVAEMSFSAERQSEVANWLYAANCRWMAAWGVECSQWDDALDCAEINAWPDGAPDSKTIMTTWHDDEPLDCMFWFIGNQVDTYDDQPLTHFLIVHLSETNKEAELKQKFIAALEG